MFCAHPVMLQSWCWAVLLLQPVLRVLATWGLGLVFQVLLMFCFVACWGREPLGFGSSSNSRKPFPMYVVFFVLNIVLDAIADVIFMFGFLFVHVLIVESLLLLLWLLAFLLVSSWDPFRLVLALCSPHCLSSQHLQVLLELDYGMFSVNIPKFHIACFLFACLWSQFYC